MRRCTVIYLTRQIESEHQMPVVPKVRLNTARVQQDSAEIANGAWLDFRFFWPMYAFGFTHTHICTRHTNLLRLLICPRDDMLVQSPHRHNARGRCPRSTGNRR
jgi:hypothetical protein